MIKREPKRYRYTDLEEGDAFEFYGITIGESHIIQFAGLTGDFNPLHVNEKWCNKNSLFKTRVVHGTYTLALVMGPLGMMFAGTALANVGMNFTLPAPVKLGDTLYTRLKVLEKREKQKHNGGLVKFNIQGINQDDITIFDGEVNLIISNEYND